MVVPMFGKLFASLYTGSMVGAGPVPFALMPYIIANARPDGEVGGQVELNPRLLATIIGTSETEIREAIEFLCKPDPHSRTPDEGGRRLIPLGPFDYRVVNYAKYRAIQDEEDRREQNRQAAERYRAKLSEKRMRKIRGRPLPGELAHVRNLDQNGAQAAEESMP